MSDSETPSVIVSIFSFPVDDDQTPLIDANMTVAGAHMIKQYEYVKYMPNTIRTSLKVEYDAYHEVPYTWNYVMFERTNNVTLKSDGYVIPRMYRITNINQNSVNPLSSNAGNSVTLDLQLDALATASWISADCEMRGFFRRSPIDMVGAPFIPRKDVMKYSKEFSLPKLAKLKNKNVYMYKISGTLPGTSAWTQGSTDTPAGTFLTIFGFCYDDSDNILDNAGIGKPYPSLLDIMNAPDKCTPFESVDAITDISISARGVFDSYFLYDVYSGSGVIRPNDSNLVSRTYAGHSWIGNATTYSFVYVTNFSDSPTIKEHSETISIELSELERMTGTLKIKDAYGNDVGTIDTRYGYRDNLNKYKIDLKVTTRSSLSNINTTVELADGTQQSFPEGHIAFNSDSYQEYSLYERQYDRGAMNLQIQRSKRESEEKAVNSMSNILTTGIISGGLSVIGGGLELAENRINKFADEYETRYAQALKEQKIKDTPDSIYNSEYGADYVILAYKTRHDCVAVTTPATITQAEMNSYIEMTGYPCEGAYRTIDIWDDIPKEGFIQCDNAKMELGPFVDPYVYWQINWDKTFARILRAQMTAGTRYKKMEVPL